MFRNKLFIILASLYLQIILPFEIISTLFIKNFSTIAEFILFLVHVLLIFYFVLNFSYWEYTSIYLRYIYCIALIIGISSAIYRNIFIYDIPLGGFSDLAVYNKKIITIVIFLIIDCSIFLSKLKKKDCFNLSFPLRNGKFLIVDGGDGKISYFTNYHYYGWKSMNASNYPSMRFAIDIIKLNKYGSGSKKLLNPSNKDFEIFEEKVYSPIEGEVVKVIKNNEDNFPYSIFPNHYGNQIVIKNGNYYVSLYHFKQDSIVVELGQKVKVGDYLGQVGNSGYSIKPHLHTQVIYSEDEEYWFGKSIPIMFDNKNPIKNSVICAK